MFSNNIVEIPKPYKTPTPAERPKPTDEQIKAVEMAKTGKSFKMIAFAGAGKTSTLILVAEALEQMGKKGLYLAFNRSIADEAGQKMPKNVTAKTFHALAYKNIPANVRKKGSMPALNFQQWVDLLRLPSNGIVIPNFNESHTQSKLEMEQLDKRLSPNEIAGTLKAYHDNIKVKVEVKKGDKTEYKEMFFKQIVNEFAFLPKTYAYTIVRELKKCLNFFYTSTEKDITPNLVNQFFYENYGIKPSNTSQYIKNLKIDFFKWLIVMYNHNLGYKANANGEFEPDDKNIYGISPNEFHSFYLKFWQLSDPKALLLDDNTPADFILYDEAQDADGLMLDVLTKQMEKGVQVIFVGDPHQQIYAWRGAVNAMANINAPSLHLTQSFRFGKNIAVFGNACLIPLKEQKTLTSGRPDIKDDTYFYPPSTNIILKENSDPAVETDLSGYFESMVTAIKDIGVNAILTRTNNHALWVCLQLSKLDIPFYLNVNKDELEDIYKSIHLLLSEKYQSGKTMFDENGQKVVLSQFFKSRCIETAQEYMDYAEKYNDLEFTQYQKTYDEYGYENIHKVLKSEPTEKAITVCTMHKSKGLEWQSVFVAQDVLLAIYRGVEQSAENAKGEANHDLASYQELQRLIYVACTRAKKTLILPTELQNYCQLQERLVSGKVKAKDQLQMLSVYIRSHKNEWLHAGENKIALENKPVEFDDDDDD